MPEILPHLYAYQKQNTQDIGAKALWFRVITQALDDAKSNINSQQMYANKVKAKAWLTGGSLDFCMVCEMAGIEPQFAKRAFQNFFDADAGQDELNNIMTEVRADANGQFYFDW